MTDFLAYTELSMLLQGGDFNRVHCNNQRRNKWGHVAASCTHGIGHLGDHYDAHAARGWRD